jgi:G:T-mismatch repair DNA endonuclease (very short patch repair protein)
MEEKGELVKVGGQEPDAESCLRKEDGRLQERKADPKHQEYWRLNHDEQLRKMMIREHKKPNKLEKRLIDLIQRENLPFKYVGNWESILGGKCPDFMSTDGKKLLIKLLGNYWHIVKARESVEERVARFRVHGYKTLVLWEKEMDDERLIADRIQRFCDEN